MILKFKIAHLSVKYAWAALQFQCWNFGSEWYWCRVAYYWLV